MSRRQPQRHETAIAVGSADEIGRIAIRSGQRFVKRHPAISLAWVVGLLVSILASGYTPSQEAVQNYEVLTVRATSGGRIKRVPTAAQHADIYMPHDGPGILIFPFFFLFLLGARFWHRKRPFCLIPLSVAVRVRVRVRARAAATTAVQYSPPSVTWFVATAAAAAAPGLVEVS